MDYHVHFMTLLHSVCSRSEYFSAPHCMFITNDFHVEIKKKMVINNQEQKQAFCSILVREKDILAVDSLA